MVLTDADGPNRLVIRVTGYQFPDAPDLARRLSWHMVGGEAHCQEGSWQFRWQALTCDESPRVSAWLAEVAGSIAQRCALPVPLRFTEPNLMFRAQPLDVGQARILVGFDLEFQPPWHRRRGAGDPFVLSFTTGEEQLRRAAGQWHAELAPFPDGSSLGAVPRSGLYRIPGCSGRPWRWSRRSPWSAGRSRSHQWVTRPLV